MSATTKPRPSRRMKPSADRDRRIEFVCGWLPDLSRGSYLGPVPDGPAEKEMSDHGYFASRHTGRCRRVRANLL